jgi:hypothetical protein
MIEDMAARKLNPHTQRSHIIYSCKRFAAWLKRSPDTPAARARGTPRHAGVQKPAQMRTLG